jgi:hypothetical protein
MASSVFMLLALHLLETDRVGLVRSFTAAS